MLKAKTVKRLGFFLLLNCKFGPFDVVILHNIARLFHSKLFIEPNGILICDQIHSNILLAARKVMRGFHKPSADSLSFVSSCNA